MAIVIIINSNIIIIIIDYNTIFMQLTVATITTIITKNYVVTF